MAKELAVAAGAAGVAVAARCCCTDAPSSPSVIAHEREEVEHGSGLDVDVPSWWRRCDRALMPSASSASFAMITVVVRSVLILHHGRRRRTTVRNLLGRPSSPPFPPLRGTPFPSSTNLRGVYCIARLVERPGECCIQGATASSSNICHHFTALLATKRGVRWHGCVARETPGYVYLL
uniref:Uncharacterized protein n=1 Tax=Anopheles braziliensis TaxID=58242 RepID=A0A2M3ZLZ6_9DIPT